MQNKFIKKILSKNYSILLVFLVIFLGFALRSYNTLWDKGEHIHPDERYMTMVIDAISVPKTWSEYFDPAISKFSPYNVDYKAYVYGTVPLHIVKYVASFYDMDDYSGSLIIGRNISAILDSLTILILFKITQFFTKKIRYQLFGVTLYAFCALAIQTSHFFTVESFLNFFVALSLYLIGVYLTSSKRSLFFNLIILILISLSSALALGCKITGLFMVALAATAVIFKNFAQFKKKYVILRLLLLIYQLLQLLLLAYLFVRLVYPYLFSTGDILDLQINKDFQSTMDFQDRAQRGEFMFPPQWQWVDTIAYVFPLKNLVLWEFGAGAGIFCLCGLIFFTLASIKGIFNLHWKNPFKIKLPRYKVGLIKKIFTKLRHPHLFNPTWRTFLIDQILLNPLTLYVGYMLVYFVYMGGRFAKAGRYFSPLYIPLIVLGVWLVMRVPKKIQNYLIVFVIATQIIWGLAYFTIYTKDNSRVAASYWIYANIPENTNITAESWDDALPMGLGVGKRYNILSMPVFDDDKEEKIPKLYESYSKADYIMVTSARAKYTVGKLPKLFPYMVNYYNKLDNGQLGFTLTHKETSYPTFLGIQFNDESAEEPFWVYDHPTVWIYKKNRTLTLEEFKKELMAPLDK